MEHKDDYTKFTPIEGEECGLLVTDLPQPPRADETVEIEAYDEDGSVFLHLTPEEAIELGKLITQQGEQLIAHKEGRV